METKVERTNSSPVPLYEVTPSAFIFRRRFQIYYLKKKNRGDFSNEYFRYIFPISSGCLASHGYFTHPYILLVSLSASSVPVSTDVAPPIRLHLRLRVLALDIVDMLFIRVFRTICKCLITW